MLKIADSIILCSIILGMSTQAESGLTKPNIILIYADDISARELPMYGSSLWSKPERGDTNDPAYLAKTPVLDQMAQEGCAIKSAWASVVCSPSRAMMMTGRYAHIHKWWNNRDVGTYTDSGGKTAVWPLYKSSAKLIGHIAREGGYGTYWAGKTQMPADLTQYGFDEGCFTPGNLRDRDNPYTDFKLIQKKVDGKKLIFNADTGRQEDTYLQHGWYWFPHVRLMNHEGTSGIHWWPNSAESEAKFGLHTYGPDVELEFTFKYMERQQKEDKPFFIYHTTHLGHDGFDWLHPDSTSSWPGTPKIEWDGKVYTRTKPKITGDDGVYDTHGTVTEPGMHSHINYLDYQVWLYQKKLDEMGIRDNTVLIFCADNGSGGYGKNSGDRQKGTHVPFVIYAPGMKKHGMQDVLMNMSDILPTIADFAGVEIPEDYIHNGESLVPFLFTDTPKHRDWIYAYRNAEQLIRGTKVMKDGRDKWWDVSAEPDDLISFPQIKDWKSISSEHRAEKKMLKAILPQFDLHESAHDASAVAN